MEPIDATKYPHPIVRMAGVRGGIAEPLIPSDWSAASHRYPNPVNAWRWKHAIACRIELTGEKVKLINGCFWRAGRIVWVGDCEPDTTSACLVRCHADGEPFSVDRAI